MATYDRILAATDFSEASRPALALACAMASDYGAELTIVHVCEVPGFADTGPIPYDVITPLAEAATKRLDALVRSMPHIPPGAKSLVKLGAAWEQILAVAGETRADLIVMGTHGRRGITHAVMGSVAERVVRLSPVPVLTVRSRAGD